METGPAPSGRLRRADPGPAEGRFWKELCKNRWPCKGVSSPSLERQLTREGPRSPAPHPSTPGGDPQVSSLMGSGLCLKGPRGELPASAAKTRAQESWHRPPPLSKGLQKSKSPASECSSAPLAEPSGKLLLPHLSTGAPQGQGRGDLQNKEETSKQR